MVEIWKDIKGYEGFYQVSNLGKLKSLTRKITTSANVERTIKGKTLKQKNTNKNYKNICLSKNDKNKFFAVHRLVAEAFVPNPDNLPQVNHKDENPSNNSANNLEWCTCKYNINYGERTNKMRKSQGKPIKQLDLNGNFIKKWECIADASKQTNISKGNICQCCKMLKRQAGGYIWRYLNE